MHHADLAMDSPFLNPALIRFELHFGGDRSPLNDADADEDPEAEVYLDPDLLGLDDFADADKLDPGYTGDIGSASLN
ncbi:hypothetical protein RRX38_00855 [Pseudomonas sp. DTU_2021_1001937_2_SI_NGA_ILE_001]|uniref:hypothetical protein n=1 Tax=Pseudomonas sp. DTU_2021_1001937_2_SI_NGA_ILE_001 TaxID=3077589 RepID=UPI0025D862A4|nr:hypothetical protein [Pseudomonas sp. DTU_2021_1001937_2_SI_NGA_ILE_001]WNW09752.1 hypothetical protein RRX38_00855 [Pseudomonas sp. DTU_2021_1001937_2_SI_NGA_ILE_001]